jgi:hypothetical protein
MEEKDANKPDNMPSSGMKLQYQRKANGNGQRK